MSTTLQAAPPGEAGTADRPATAAGAPPARPRGRRRAGGGIILLPPWTRAPLLPWRQPAVILAVAGAAAILACASASAALFLSSASSESLRRIVAADCPDAGYPAVWVGPIGNGGAPIGDGSRVVDPSAKPADDAGVRAAMTGAGLADPARTQFSGGQTPPVQSASTNKVARLFTRDGATARITPVGPRVAGRGIWVPQLLATQLQVRAGDTVRIGAPNAPPVRVVGVYRNLFESYDRAYWCSYTWLFLNPSYGNDSTPPPLVITTDAATFTAIQDGYGGTSAGVWVSPVDTADLTLTRARDVADRQHRAYEAFGAPERTDFATRNSGSGQMPRFVERTELIRDGLRGPVLPIALGGSLLALLLVGAAGSYWADRRAREVRLLSSRGVGPGALAAKAALELALPALLGTAIGWLLARWLVTQLGPSSLLDPSAPAEAAVTAGIAALAGIALLALVAGLRSRAATERPVGARRSRLAAVPWEVLLLVAALLCYLRLRGGDAVRTEEGIAQLNLLVVAFPLLFLAGGAVLLVRLLALALPALSRRAGRLSPAWWLAVRRVTSSRVVSVVLLAAASTPIAMLVYAAGLTQTSQYTLDAKAQLYTGAPTTAQTLDPLRRTPGTDAVGTVVVRYLYGKADGLSGDIPVLAVDPDTFARTAFWDRRFADASLDDLMAALRSPTPAGTVPAIVVPEGRDVRPTFDLELGSTRVKVDVVARARLFPGRRLPGPMIVVDRTRLGTVDAYAGTTNELWTRGTDDVVRAAVEGQRARIFSIDDQASVFQAANFLGVSWSFGYLTALAALVGLVAIGGLLLYLETRQRTRVASYALGRRMGLTRGRNLRSLLAELGVLLGLAWVVGAGLAWAAVLMVYGRLDIDATRLPQPLLTVPVAALAGSAAAVALVVILASLYAQRSADRADVAEVLRLGS